MPSKSASFDGLAADLMSMPNWDSYIRLQPGFQPEDIVDELRERQVSLSHTSKVRRFIKRTKPLVDVVQHHAKAIDIASNACPEIICPLWAPLRALLNVVAAADDYFSRLTEMLQQIADVLPRYRIYAQLFGNHEPLQDAISKAHSAVTTFVFEAAKVYDSSSRVVNSALWKKFDQKFEESLNQLRKHSKNVEKEASVAHMIEEANARNEMRAELASTKAQLDQLLLTIRLGVQIPSLAEVGRWLGARECHEERRAVKDRVSGCEWVFDRREFTEWINPENHIQLFWVHGPTGCGKSFLYSKLLEQISSGNRKNSAYFFFCEADKERVSFSALLRSWTFQLIKLIWISDQAQETLRSVQNRLAIRPNQEATPADVLDLLMYLLNAHDMPSCFLTVDALDECVDWQEFFRLLPQIPARFKVFLTSNDFPDSQEHLQPMAGRFSTLAMTPELTQGDIDRYLCSAVANLKTQTNGDIPGHVKLRIKEKLRDSGGMFLLVRLMIEDIQGQTTVKEVNCCLDRLPKSLSERYDRIMKWVNDQKESCRLLAHKVFFWVLTAPRPLTPSELFAALAVRPALDRANAFDDDDEVLGDPRSLITTVCGSFIQARGGRGTLYPSHATTTQYLKEYMSLDGRMAEIASSYQVPQLLSPQGLAAAICIRYLSSDLISALRDRAIDGTQAADAILSSGTPQLNFLRHATAHWFRHARAVDGAEWQETVLPLAKELLDSSRPNAAILWRLYWFSGAEGDLNKSPGGCPANFSGLHIAAYLGLANLVRGLLHGQDLNVVDGSGKTPLWWAAARGQTEVVKVLIEAGAEMS